MDLLLLGLRRGLLLAIVGSGLIAGTAIAANGYQVHNLVSDGGVPADHRDDHRPGPHGRRDGGARCS